LDEVVFVSKSSTALSIPLRSSRGLPIWQLPIIEHKIYRHRGRPWKRQRPFDKPHDDDDDAQSNEIDQTHATSHPVT